MKKTASAEVIVGNRMHELLQMWEEGVQMGMKGYLKMGKAVFFLKKEKLWKREVEHVPSFKYWVEHSLHISVAQAYKLAEIYERVGSVLEKASIVIDISKVTLLLPFLIDKTDEQKIDILVHNKDLTYEDVKNNIADLKGTPGKATDVCSHDPQYLEQVTRCRNCGKWVH